MFGLGMTELVVILVLGLLLFGSQLPKVARWLGQSAAEFTREARSLTEEVRSPGDRVA